MNSIKDATFKSRPFGTCKIKNPGLESCIYRFEMIDYYMLQFWTNQEYNTTDNIFFKAPGLQTVGASMT